MTRTRFSTIAFVVATLFAGQAMAADTSTSLTREQVKAELLDAIQTGNVVLGESSARLNEMLPEVYPAQQPASSLTREQVKADLAEAVRAGNVTLGESSVTLSEAFPQQYASQQQFEGKTRGQVKAELAEAISLGQYPAFIEA